MISKFRRAIHQSLGLARESQYNFPEPTQSVLVHVTSGPNSAVLVDLVEKECFPSTSALAGSVANGSPATPTETKGRKRVNKREQLWKKPIYVYVELCAAYPGRPDRSELVKENLQRICPGRDIVVLRLEDAFDPEWWKRIHTTQPSPAGLPDLLSSLHTSLPHTAAPKSDPTASDSQTPKERLTHFLNSLPTLSAKSTMISQLTRMLLLHTARSTRYNCCHILVADSLFSVAVSLISSVAEGGGFNLQSEWEEKWEAGTNKQSGTDTPVVDSDSSRKATTEGEVMILKPLRDVTAKECGVFFRWRNLSPLCSNQVYRGETDADQGIRKLTRDFIAGLDKDFPSTVNAIVRTIGKVTPKTDLPLGRCRLCQRATPFVAETWNARTSIRTLSSQVTNSDQPTEKRTPTATTDLCYACHTALTSRGAKSVAVISEKPAPMPMWALKQEIGEFLLSDDEDEDAVGAEARE